MYKYLQKRALALILCLGAMYGLAYLSDYRASPLGRVAVLDGQENMLFAQDFRSFHTEVGSGGAGGSNLERFYRAPGYAWVLSWGFRLDLSEAEVLAVAQVLGLLLHLTNVVLVYYLAKQLWQLRAGALLAAGIYTFYPVAVYFAVEPLDITLGIALMLGGLASMIQASRLESLRGLAYFGCMSGLLLSTAVLVRPHMLTVALLSPIVAWLAVEELRKRLILAAMVGSGVILGLLGTGLFQTYYTGNFHVMPWQGPYNLYAANMESSNGRYYVQNLEMPSGTKHVNPARFESVVMYQRAMGLPVDGSALPPSEIDAFNRYWRGQTWQAIAADPQRWLVLMFRKAYYLLNNAEQYNNKTYAFHHARSPALFLNPLHWTLLLGLACTAVVFMQPSQRARCWPFMLSGLSYAGGVLLFYVSSRFRLPLVPLLCVAAGGLALFRQQVLPKFKERAVWLFVIAICVTTLGYTRLWNVADKSTFVQDRMLLANAAARLADDHAAYGWAAEVLSEAKRADALRVWMLSAYNLHLSGEANEQTADWATVAEQYEGLQARLPDGADDLRYVYGVALWNCGQQTLAREIWLSLGKSNIEAQAALIATSAIKDIPPPYKVPASLMLEAAYSISNTDYRSPHFTSDEISLAVIQLNRLLGLQK